MQTIIELCTTVVGKALLALIVWIVGKFIIKKILGLVEKIKALDKIEPNTRTFVVSAVRWLLYIMLVVSIVAILGVPMASVITVLGTAGAAIALSLQGSLSNLAGGIMLVIFKPFKVGDFVEAAGVSGFVKEITMFYTVLNTVDNCRIHVPNGSLMNANIIDYSAEDTRRVDLSFACAKSENPAAIQNLILETLSANEKVACHQRQVIELYHPETYWRKRLSAALPSAAAGYHQRSLAERYEAAFQTGDISGAWCEYYHRRACALSAL